MSVTDSRGTSAVAEFSGSARIGDPVWYGQYEVRPQLAAETAWIELLGERVELTAWPAGIQTWAEPLPAQDPAVRHVWERVATLNDFHDPHLALDGLESRDEHFGVTVELVPGAHTGLPYGGLPDQQHLTWWAVDNLGNYYLGEQGSWNPGDNRSWGAIGFWPALDQRATSIDLIPTAATARAVIRVPRARTPRAKTTRPTSPLAPVSSDILIWENPETQHGNK